jgi:hypothetical protein
VTALVTLAGAIAAALISATNLTFELWPGLKPDPKEKIGGGLAILAVDENLTRGEYATRLGTSARPPHSDDTGNVFYLRARIEGFKRESLHVKWFVYENTSRRRWRGASSGRSEEAIFKPNAPINTQIAQVWVKNPPLGQNQDILQIFVRFELYSGNVLLAFVDSRPIRLAVL